MVILQTQEEYLKRYRIEDYDRPSVTADVCAFRIREEATDSYRKDSERRLAILLVKRGEHPFLGQWALPGGFLRSDETLEACAVREITEETGIVPAGILPVEVFSAPDRDPRGRIISSAYISIMTGEQRQPVGGTDAMEAAWFDIMFFPTSAQSYLLRLTNGEMVLEAQLLEETVPYGRPRYTIVDSGALAFDHARIIATAMQLLRTNVKNFRLLFDFLPERFTLTALQKVREAILAQPVIAANFRRTAAEYIEETGEYAAVVGHRPAMLFRKKTLPD